MFAAIQFVPYGRGHTNPPVTQAAAFGQGAGVEIVRGACFDCHSNQTAWPWYTSVAPFSWLIQHDVEEGRSVVNFSEWDRPQDGASDLVEVVQDGGMPPWSYTLAHPAARLSERERQELIVALQEMLRRSPPVDDGGSGRD